MALGGMVAALADALFADRWKYDFDSAVAQLSMLWANALGVPHPKPAKRAGCSAQGQSSSSRWGERCYDRKRVKIDQRRLYRDAGWDVLAHPRRLGHGLRRIRLVQSLAARLGTEIEFILRCSTSTDASSALCGPGIADCFDCSAKGQHC
jgi:hypothetical protein